MNKKVLITGFEPFGREPLNPSWEAVRLLPDYIGGNDIVKLRLPVEFGRAAELAWNAALECDADAILSVGLAGGRRAVNLEKIAVNLRNGKIGDASFFDDPCVPDAPAAYFTDLPIRRMSDALKAAEIPVTISYSAGMYVCNDTMYTLLHNAALHEQSIGKRINVGFVHVPFITIQERPGVFTMPLDLLVEAIMIAVEQI